MKNKKPDLDEITQVMFGLQSSKPNILSMLLAAKVKPAKANEIQDYLYEQYRRLSEDLEWQFRSMLKHELKEKRRALYRRERKLDLEQSLFEKTIVSTLKLRNRRNESQANQVQS